MPIDYSAPERDMRFVMQELVCFEQVAALCGYEEFSQELITAILQEAS